MFDSNRVLLIGAFLRYNPSRIKTQEKEERFRKRIMHELGIVFHIADKVRKVAEENDVTKVNKVVCEIGEVSTIIGEYLIDCWNWNAKRYPVLDGCELLIETIPAITYCEDCHKQYETVKYGKICPHCQSEHTYLIQGNETEIKEIEVE